MEFEYYQDKEGNAYELKTNLEKLLVHEIFEQGEEIERLNKELQDTKEHLGEYLHEQEEENKRINNIINELEKTLLEWHEYWEDDDSYSWQYKNTYDYLQELKGSDKDA